MLPDYFPLFYIFTTPMDKHIITCNMYTLNIIQVHAVPMKGEKYS